MSSAAAALATSATERALLFFEPVLLDSPAAVRPLLVAGDAPFLADDLPAFDFDAAAVFFAVFFPVDFFFVVDVFFFDGAFLLVDFFFDAVFLAFDLAVDFFFFVVFFVVDFLPFTEVFFFPPVDFLRVARVGDDEPERFFDPAREDEVPADFFFEFMDAVERDADDFPAVFRLRVRPPDPPDFFRVFDFDDDFFFEVATAGILPRPC